jgi:hypothetical protein
VSDQHTPTREMYEEALNMTRCPYYLCGEKCDTGCYSEPACVTGTPTEGWESIIDAYWKAQAA